MVDDFAKVSYENLIKLSNNGTKFHKSFSSRQKKISLI